MHDPIKRVLPVACVVIAVLASTSLGQGLLPPLNASETPEARDLIAAMKENPRGPYAAIRWYCKDGSVHSPQGSPCKERGGGYQHAALSPMGRRLSELHLFAGNILTRLPFESFLDSGNDFHRLRALVLEKYLYENDDGWILRRARFYRGARQVEDEEIFGRKLLIELLSHPEWNRRHYLLANELVRTLSHSNVSGIGRRVRALAREIAGLEPLFEALRAKIHSSPDAGDAERVRRFLKSRAHNPEVEEKLRQLLDLYGKREKLHGVAQIVERLGLPPELKAKPEEFLERVATVSLDYRDRVSSSSDGKMNLALLDSNLALLDTCFDVYTEAGLAGLSRRQILRRVRSLARLAMGAGLLTQRERASLEREIEKLEASTEVDAEDYHRSIRYLGRSLQWAHAGVMETFGTVARRYGAVEPTAHLFLDSLLRSSVVLRLSHAINRLQVDADRALGSPHRLLGHSAPGVRAMNPGLAVGRLHVHRDGRSISDSKGIYVLPETLPEMEPVAGILTLERGNPLSHMQLLARNLGIPSAVLPEALLPLVTPQEGVEVLFAVSERGGVILQSISRLNKAEKELWTFRQARGPSRRFDLKSRRVNLRARKILLLQQLRASDSGVLAGPKAANLGELSRIFPKQVAPGLVIPFGIYLAHIQRILDSSGSRLSDQIHEAYSQAEKMRQRGATQNEINKVVFPRLNHFRSIIEHMALLPEFEKELRSVPSEKSGVMVTTVFDSEKQDGITVAVAEGVGGVVAGGTAETLILRGDGTVQFLSQAHSPYKRVLLTGPGGGIHLVPVSGADTLLHPDDIQTLRNVAEEVEGRFPPAYDRDGHRMPWDIEFGFVGGRLRLFQIRPQVQNHRWESAEALPALSQRHGPARRILLEQKPHE